MLPPLVKSKALSALPRHWRWADVLGASKASGRRSPLASGSDRRVSCQAGSKWRSYHFTYSSTITPVAQALAVLSACSHPASLLWSSVNAVAATHHHVSDGDCDPWIDKSWTWR